MPAKFFSYHRNLAFVFMLSAYHIKPHSIYSIWKNTFFPTSLAHSQPKQHGRDSRCSLCPFPLQILSTCVAQPWSRSRQPPSSCIGCAYCGAATRAAGCCRCQRPSGERLGGHAGAWDWELWVCIFWNCRDAVNFSCVTMKQQQALRSLQY